MRPTLFNFIDAIKTILISIMTSLNMISNVDLTLFCISRHVLMISWCISFHSLCKKDRDPYFTFSKIKQLETSVFSGIINIQGLDAIAGCTKWCRAELTFWLRTQDTKCTNDMQRSTIIMEESINSKTTEWPQQSGQFPVDKFYT